MKAVARTEDTPEQHAEQVTTFHEQSLLTSEVISGRTPSLYFSQPGTIEDFLKRPLPLGTYVWSPTFDINSVLARLGVPGSHFKFDSVKEKIARFKYFRGDFKFSFRVNGNRFHYGKLLCVWLPRWQMRTQERGNPYAHLTGFSAMNWVILTPSENEVVELVCPFIMPTDYINIDDNLAATNQMGQLEIIVLNPLKSVDEVFEPELTVYGNWVNPQLTGQSNTGTPAWTNVTANTEALVPPYTAFTQGDTGGTGNGAISALAGALGGATGSALWGGIRSAYELTKDFDYGFLKQRTSEKTDKREPQIVVQKGWDLSTSRTTTTTQPLATDAEAKVNPYLELMGSKPCETDFSYMAQIPTLYDITTWSASDSGGTVLFNVPCSPYTSLSKVILEGTRFYPTLLHFISRPFDYWRGSIKFTVQVTCSMFHSGRLNISFQPDLASAASEQEIYNRFNHVMDIQKETEFSFIVPYVSNKPFLETTESFGKIDVSVANTLSSPGTIATAQSVYINVWISAGPDFQLAYPEANLITRRHDPFTTQGMTRGDMMNANYQPIGPMATHIDDKCCFPDQIKSVYDLVRRKQYYNHGESGVGQWRLTCYNTVWWKDHGVSGWKGRNFLDWFSSLYLFQRGGMDYAFRWFSGISSNKLYKDGLLLLQFPRTFDKNLRAPQFTTIQDGEVFSYSMTGAYLLAPPTNAVAEIFCPYNSPLRFAEPYSVASTENGNSVFAVGEDFEIVTFKGAGSDFVYGYLGPPPSYVTGSVGDAP